MGAQETNNLLSSYAYSYRPDLFLSAACSIA